MTDKEVRALFEERGINPTERELELLMFRFGLEDGEPKTLEETAQKFGITRERVRQIENKLLRRPVHLRRTKKIRDFYQ